MFGVCVFAGLKFLTEYSNRYEPFSRLSLVGTADRARLRHSKVDFVFEINLSRLLNRAFL